MNAREREHLEQHIAELRKCAANIRQTAQRAGRLAYHEEMAAARDLESRANTLERKLQGGAK